MRKASEHDNVVNNDMQRNEIKGFLLYFDTFSNGKWNSRWKRFSDILSFKIYQYAHKFDMY